MKSEKIKSIVKVLEKSFGFKIEYWTYSGDASYDTFLICFSQEKDLHFVRPSIYLHDFDELTIAGLIRKEMTE